jgi:hypothetical protein
MNLEDPAIEMNFGNLLVAQMLNPLEAEETRPCGPRSTPGTSPFGHFDGLFRPGIIGKDHRRRALGQASVSNKRILAAM